MIKKHLISIIKIEILLIILSQIFYYACNSIEPDSRDEQRIDSINVFIQNWKIYNTENSNLPGNSIKALAVDNQNNLWIGTFSNGLAKLCLGTWIIYNTNNSALPNDTINCIIFDKNNNLWIGTNNGLAKYDGHSWINYSTSNSILPYRVISSLAVDKNNLLWIGCGHLTAGGILSLIGNNWMLYTKENSSLPSSIINVIHVDEKNNKWIGTTGGLVKIDNYNNWSVYTKQNSGLLFGVNAVASDLENNVWIGSNELARLDYGHYYGGLQKFDGINWIDYRPHPNGEYNPNAIVSNRVDHIICERFGYLLIATETEWKYPYNLSFFKNGTWKNLSDMADGFPINLFIRDIMIDNSNTVWLATQAGVIYFNYISNSK